MAPVLRELADQPVDLQLAVTGQHPDLLASCLQELGLRPEHALAPFRGEGLGALMAHVMEGLSPVLDRVSPHWVVVHGDTTSALAAAVAATYAEIPVAHVEAGLRTADPRSPFPEELNRRALAALASMHFAPTPGARGNLLAEGVAPERIYVTGNPVVDALQAQSSVGLGELALEGSLVLVTCHRRETHGAPLQRVCDAVEQLAQPHRTIVWPLHLHPRVQEPVKARLAGRPGITLTPPMSHRRFLDHVQRASLILTDSGGVQEEAAWLGRPTLVLRERTERPEVLESGVVQLVGCDARRICQAAEAWLADPPSARAFGALGDGRSGARIARILANVSTDVPCRL